MIDHLDTQSLQKAVGNLTAELQRFRDKLLNTRVQQLNYDDIKIWARLFTLNDGLVRDLRSYMGSVEDFTGTINDSRKLEIYHQHRLGLHTPAELMALHRIDFEMLVSILEERDVRKHYQEG